MVLFVALMCSNAFVCVSFLCLCLSVAAQTTITAAEVLQPNPLEDARDRVGLFDELMQLWKLLGFFVLFCFFVAVRSQKVGAT